MTDKEAKHRLEVTCPLCRGTLTIDPETGIVLHAAPPSGPGRDFEEVLGEVKSAASKREEQFSKAFQLEKQRRASLDKKFETAREKAARRKECEPHSPARVS